MRAVQGIILLIFLAAIGIFAYQNTEPITVRFLDQSRSFPLALTILGVYLLGMISGWTVVSFLRRSIRNVTEERR